MKSTDYLKLQEYYRYLEFIQECRSRNYDSNLVKHVHHIIPRFLKPDIPDKLNTVELSVEDHIQAHLLLAECFTEGSYERLTNIRSAKLLSRNSIKDVSLLQELYRYSTGEGNPFYGKTHTDETKEKLRQATIKHRTGKEYATLYETEERALVEKQKRAQGVKKVWESRTQERKQEIVEKVRKSKVGLDTSGAKNPNAKRILVDSVEYGTVDDAIRKLGKSRYRLFREHKITYI